MAFSQFGTNANARKKRVYYTEGSTIYEGMPVCYEFDATANVLDYDKGAGGDRACQTSPTTTAEGNQNEGKFMRVEDPDTGNIQFFAGVVAGSSYAGLVGPRWLDIYIPNGAIVPVRADVQCTVGRTILAVESASQELTVPLAANQARPVAIAAETTDLSSVSGLTLAKLDASLFITQDNTGDPLIIDDDAAAAVTVNSINLLFNGTGGPKRGLYAVGEIAGLGHATWGMWKYRSYLSAALVSNVVHTLCANLHFKDGAEIAVTSGHWNSAMYASVETEVSATAPDLSGGSVAGLSLEYYVDESTGAPIKAYALYVHAGTYNWDGLLAIRNAGDCGDYTSTGDAPALATGDKMIPVDIAGTTYYLVALADSGV
ncbi:hypothetical protein LCGC14_0624010 [marine sediment metagenome]|uniref:Uncharacterized protein n=1 Tax=marine sediment metagenome TaxID=412755 RepID=A0A0F9UCG6_9ZZZZ